MKTVLLLRHAKSDWGDADLADFDRPLAKRGLRDAPRMGEVLAAFDIIPNQIIASPAERARQTATLVAESSLYSGNIEWDASFYGGGSEDMFSALQRLPQSVNVVLLVGHNPTMEETAADLLMPADISWDYGPAIRVPTAGLLCFEVHITDWRVLRPGDGMLQWFLVPRLAKAIVEG
jgi:phosphohistidine phosphatase